MGKYDVNAINLKVYDVTPIHGGIILRWTSSLGFDEYTIFTSDLKDDEEDRKWVAMSECMDRGEDKEFGKKLLELWISGWKCKKDGMKTNLSMNHVYNWNQIEEIINCD